MRSEWTVVTSSILDAVAYDPDTGRLRIRFRSGAIFEYEGVPSIVYDELLAAPLKGGYFSEYVRPEYRYRRVQPSEEGVPATPR